jgi:uncharacterized protein (TIGR02231 family)
MILRLSAACLSMVLSCPAALLAAEIEIEAPISAVTVYPDRAEVTRLIESAVPAGATTFVVGGLPADLMPDSVRVSGESNGTVLIGSVETAPFIAETPAYEPDPKIEAELEALRDRRRAVEDRSAVAKMQIDYYALILQAAPEVADKQLIRAMDPAQWQQVWSAVGANTAQARETLRLAEMELRAIDGAIAEKARAQSEPAAAPSPSMMVRVNIDATAPATARLRISYQLAGASWRPVYDAHLDSEQGKVKLTQFAEVRQHTSEDWSQVALTLSNLRPSAGAALPELSPWFVPAYDPMQLAESARAAGQTNAAPGSDDTMQPAVPNTAQLIVTEFAAVYRVPGVIGIPADNASHRVVIAEHEFAGKLAARTVPKLAPVAHLYATIAYAGSEPLLPGPLSVFRDGAFIGTSNLALLRPAEEVSLGFGVDDKIRVEYRVEDRKQEGGGLFDSTRRVERRFRLTVANHHSQPLEIAVLDQLPVPSDERIEVALLGDTTKPFVADWEDRKGVLAWTRTLAPAEEEVIKFGYVMTYPDDLKLGGF